MRPQIKRKPKAGTEKRWRAFAAEYVKDLNPRRAYLECGCFNSKESSASVNASNLLANPYVQSYIQELIEERNERMHISQDLIVAEMLRVGMSDITNYLSWGPEGVRWKASGELTEDESRAIDQVEMWEDVIEFAGRKTTKRKMKLRLHNKTTGLEQLAKHLGMYKERVEVNHTFGTVEVPAMADPDDWALVVDKQIEHVNGDRQTDG